MQPDPGLLRFQHNVNFISARVFCTRCVASGCWNQPLDEECDICGEHRTFTWATEDFTKTDADKKFICDNPLNEFVKWLLYYFNKKYPQRKFPSLCLAHNGVVLFYVKYYIKNSRENMIVFWYLVKSFVLVVFVQTLYDKEPDYIKWK